MRTCTWAPTVFQGTAVVQQNDAAGGMPADTDLLDLTQRLVRRYEELGFSDLLIAQRWWGSGTDIEGSSLDCLAMTALFAGFTRRMNLVTAIHPGFFQPTAIAKWGATLARLTGGRWSINVTSGWNLQEFDMYGIDALDHDARYARAREFIEVLRGCWTQSQFSYAGDYYQANALALEPRPGQPLEVFQGGQSEAAMQMAAQHSDWMFLNGGPPERIGTVIDKVRKHCQTTGRQVRFAMYAAPLCRESDAQAWQEIEQRLAQVDSTLLQQRHARLRQGAQGMWADEDDPLAALDTNEGYVPRLIGNSDTILQRIQVYADLGVEMLHLDAGDSLFNQHVLPQLQQL